RRFSLSNFPQAGTNSAPPQPAISVSGLLSGQTGVVLKADKPMAPASRRVREAAEALLAVLMLHAGTFPGPLGPESTCSRLHETELVSHLEAARGLVNGSVGQKSALGEEGNDVWRHLATSFRYYWIEPGLIISILELPQRLSEATVDDRYFLRGF
ncbi:unnamed protein product, partial [Protopolystoma xenopodis]